MKKSIYWGIIALATLSLASCSKDEVIERVPQNDAIEFSTYLGRDITTRGEVFTTDKMDDAYDGTDNPYPGFGVFAFYTGQEEWSDYKEGTSAYPNFMYNQQVTHNGSAWEYNPKKYWPATKAGSVADKITFFAYAPYTNPTGVGNGMTVSANNANGTPTVTYSIDQSNLDKMADFVADALIDETKQATDGDELNNVNEPVTFALNHELTRVNIKASLSADAFSDVSGNVTDKTKVNIKNITIVGPAGKSFTKATYTFAQADDARGSWAFDTTTPVVNSWSIFDTELINNAAATGLGDYTEDGVSVSSTSAVNVFETNQYLFLIPVNGTTGVATGSEVYMEIEYDIVTADAALNGTYSCTPATKKVVLPAGTLQQGVAYTFNLIFGMNEITLSAEVDGWSTAIEKNEDVDYDDTDI